MHKALPSESVSQYLVAMQTMVSDSVILQLYSLSESQADTLVLEAVEHEVLAVVAAEVVPAVVAVVVVPAVVVVSVRLAMVLVPDDVSVVVVDAVSVVVVAVVAVVESVPEATSSRLARTAGGQH